MRFLIDMNLSPRLSAILRDEGWDAVHWSDVGEPAATDEEIMRIASREDFVVLTHDLDFGTILAATEADGPSVVQIRTQDVRPSVVGPLILRVIRQYEQELESGILLIVDEARARVRILPLRRG